MGAVTGPLIVGLACLAIAVLNFALGGGLEANPWGPVSMAALGAAGIYLIALAARSPKPSATTTEVKAPTVAAVSPPTPPAGASRADLAEAEVVTFLSLLQQKGRLIDFLMDDITTYSDTQVGAAARVVHQGCAGVLKEYLDIVPLQTEGEGAAVTLEGNYDPGRYRLVGRVVGRPPFRGTVVHRGWLATRITLPKLVSAESARKDVLAPAEIEVN